MSRSRYRHRLMRENGGWQALALGRRGRAHAPRHDGAVAARSSDRDQPSLGRLLTEGCQRSFYWMVELPFHGRSPAGPRTGTPRRYLVAARRRGSNHVVVCHAPLSPPLRSAFRWAPGQETRKSGPLTAKATRALMRSENFRPQPLSK
jgi:hypothetical protein